MRKQYETVDENKVLNSKREENKFEQ